MVGRNEEAARSAMGSLGISADVGYGHGLSGAWSMIGQNPLQYRHGWISHGT